MTADPRWRSPIEWVALSPELVVIATETRAMLHTLPQLGSDAFAEPMRDPGTPDTAFWLLEGAIAAAGCSRRLRVGQPRAKSTEHFPLTAERWAYRLAGYFHTTDATHRLLPRILRRFVDARSPVLVEWAEQKIREERGHEELALADLGALGYRGRELSEGVIPARAAAWAKQLEDIAEASDPVRAIGYAHALERLALLRGAAEILAIEARLPVGVRATRCLRVHSAIGSDTAHVRTNVCVTAALTAPERSAVVRACHAAAWTYFDPELDRAPDQNTLVAMLAPFRVRRRNAVERSSGKDQEQTGG